MVENENYTGLEIAVIGMSGRFPGANNINEFWDNIKNGIESINFFSEEELSRIGVPPELYNHPNYVKSAGGFLDNYEYFDANFFNYTHTEAELLDPQLRLFHECAWEALENGGYDPSTYEGLIGLFAGAEDNTDWRTQVILSTTDPNALYGRLLLSCKDFVSARVSYKLNLKGPVYAIVTGCSTALTSIHLACRSLLGGECDMALAGGVYIHPNSHMGYIYEPGMLQSQDGHLRAFDVKASGTVFSSGVGIVLLKPLDDALADNDHIYAMIKGSAVNSDGDRKVNFTAPSIEGQTKVIKAAYQAAEIPPESIVYLETHGTGTMLGDPIEISALKQAFNTSVNWKCPLGSVKTNIGHLDAAAGAASFIKAIFILMHRLIPPSLNFEIPNPKAGFENCPFYVNTQLQELKSEDSPLRVAVSSFGFGGTNAHVILEEAPPATLPSHANEEQLILLSAITSTALETLTQKITDFFLKNPLLPLADAAYTLQVGRKQFPYRKMCVCNSIERFIHDIPIAQKVKSIENPPLIFLFSGQGSQYVNMGKDIYRHEPVFKEQMDKGFEILTQLTGKNFKEIFYPSGSIDEAQEKMNDAINSGPIKLLFEYSLGKMLMNWGIYPNALLGHSFGEYTAACLAGVFSIEDALTLSLIRGELMLHTPPGGMMSIALSSDEINGHLQRYPNLFLAAENSSALCFISGPIADIDSLEKELAKENIECIRINFPRAAHSPLIEGIVDIYTGKVSEINLKEATIPIISSLTGARISPGQMTSANYWGQHLVQPVLFSKALDELLKETNCIFLQAGSDRGLPLFINQHQNKKSGIHVINLVKHKKDKTGDGNYLMQQLGNLWLQGVKINWTAFHSNEKRKRIPLPTYPFESKPYMLKLNQNNLNNFFNSPKKNEKSKRKNISSWLYTISWKRFIIPRERNIETGKKNLFLVFTSSCHLDFLLIKKLTDHNHEVIIIKPGEKLIEEENLHFTINPSLADDYDQLFQLLKTKNKIPKIIIHFWNTNREDAFSLTINAVEKTMELGFFSLLYTVQSLGRLAIQEDIQLEVITNNLFQVVGEEAIFPAKAPILGALNIISQEYPNLTCQSIDIVLPGAGSVEENKLLNLLFLRFTQRSTLQENPVMALRGNQYWIPVYEPIPGRKSSSFPSLLREKGVYLITGGLGGIGFELAKFLIKKVKARLVLTGRSQIPEKNRWDEWLNTHSEENSTSEKLIKIKKLEELGGKVLFFTADSAHPGQMQQVISKTIAQFGQVNGLIHTAGLVDEYGIIQNRTKEMTEKILAPKIKGTLLLDQLTRQLNLDFFIICSSLASVFPGFGEVGYAAANLFIDAFAHYKTLTDQTFTVAINWDTWQDVGAAVNIVKKKQSAGKSSLVQLKDGISSKEGIDVFAKILEIEIPQVIVSTKDLNFLLKRRYGAVEADKKSLGDNEKEEDVSIPVSYRQRPNLSTTYTPPQTIQEKKLCQIWQEYFGIEKIGIMDDFFELGGDSLMATILASRIFKRLNIRIPLVDIFQGPNIKYLAQLIQSKDQSEQILIPLVEKKEYYPISSAQKRLFILQQLDINNTSYNSPSIFMLSGELFKDQLKQCLTHMCHRHESLRTSFKMVAGKAVQIVADQIETDMEYFDESDQDANTIIDQFMKPFYLYQAPLWRIGLIKTQNQQHIFMFDMHHIITDGTSIEIFSKEFLDIYQNKKFSPLFMQYKDFAVWQNLKLKSGELKNQEEYWKKEFSGDIPVINLPIDFPRPEIQQFIGKKFRFQLDLQYAQKINQLSQDNEVTLYMTLLSLIKVFLFKLSEQETIIVGTSTVGRQHEDLQSVIGMFVNTLPLKSHPLKDKPFDQFLKEIKFTCVKAFDNQDYPFEELVDQLSINRDMSRNPLFDVMFSFQNYEKKFNDTSSSNKVDHLITPQKRPYEYEENTSRFDLTFFISEAYGSIEITLEYCTKIFKSETIIRYINYLKQLITEILQTPHIHLSKINIISAEEKQMILHEFNLPKENSTHDKTIIQLFDDGVEQNPHHSALKGHSILSPTASETEKELPAISITPDRHKIRTIEGNVHLTYGELYELSNRLASRLKEMGTQIEAVIAIMMERSIELIIGILGVLKSNAAYLPLSSDYPTDRINFVLSDSQANILITDGKKPIEIKNSPITINLMKTLQEDPLTLKEVKKNNSSRSTTKPLHSIKLNNKQLAYIIYTSGSTGTPKGVLVGHHSVKNMLIELQNRYPLRKRDTFMFKTSALFDVSVTELFSWIYGDGELLILEREGEKSPKQILNAIKKYQVTHINFVPSMFQLLLNILTPSDIHQLDSLKYIFLAGEAVPPQLVRQFRELKTNIQLENLYGPTETTIYSTRYGLSDWMENSIIPIGNPLPNEKIYILNIQNLFQPPGITGEICIGGAGLARGYLNQPEPTAEKFIYLTPNERIFKTGDFGRWNWNGNIQFLGRKDQQVKLRGFRIELGEIENQMSLHEKIQSAVVIIDGAAPKNQEYLLLAFYVLKNGNTLEKNELREFLKQKLPSYMIPSQFIELDKMPTTVSGKIQRRSLQKPKTYPSQLKNDEVVPCSDMEVKIMEIWQEVLPVKNMGIIDNIFDLGGNSYHIIQINHLMEEKLGIALPVILIFRYPTIQTLVQHLNSQLTDEKMNIENRSNALKRSKRERLERIQKNKQKKKMES